MIRRTSDTSASGATLTSEMGEATSCPTKRLDTGILEEHGQLEYPEIRGVQPVAGFEREVVVEERREYREADAARGGDQRLRDAGRDDRGSARAGRRQV